MKLMLVLEGVPVAFVHNSDMMAVFDAKAAQSVPDGYAVGQRHIIDPYETGAITDETCSIVWDVLDVRSLA